MTIFYRTRVPGVRQPSHPSNNISIFFANRFTYICTDFLNDKREPFDELNT